MDKTTVRPENQIDYKITQEFLREVTGSLFLFCREILGYDKLEPEVHYDMCEFVSGNYIENEDDYKNRKLVLMPRDSFKCTIITVGFSLQQLVINPDLRILIASENFSNSKRYLKEIKDHFQSNDRLRAIYGDFVGKKDWREDFITVSQRKKIMKEPSITCAGLDVVKVGMHYDLIICDDLVSDKNTTSREMMDKVKDFYKLSLGLLDSGNNARMIIIGTRWHFNDLYNYLIENERHVFNYFKRSAIREDGTLFFPQRLTKQFLEERRISMGSAFFSCQYQNEPVDKADAKFKKEWIGYYEPEDLPPLSQMNKYITLDPAISEGKEADFSAIIVVGVDHTNTKYVLDALRLKVQPYELIDILFMTCKNWNPEVVAIETVVFQRMLKYMFNQKMDDEKTFFNVVELKTNYTKSKDMRIMALQPIFEYGQIKIRKEHEDLEDELIRFPKGAHDDLIDALAHQVNLWACPTKKDEKKTNYWSFEWFMEKAQPKQKNYQIGKYIDRSVNGIYN